MLVGLFRLIAFGSRGWMMFYFFFESCLVPTLFLVLFWGYQPERLHAGLLLVVYTVFSSLPLLVSLVGFELWWRRDNFLLFYLCSGFTMLNSGWLWFVMSLRFLVKCPVYFLHG